MAPHLGGRIHILDGGSRTRVVAPGLSPPQIQLIPKTSQRTSQRICSISFSSPWQEVPQCHGDGLGGINTAHGCGLFAQQGSWLLSIPPPCSSQQCQQLAPTWSPGLPHPAAAPWSHFPNWFGTGQGRVGECCLSPQSGTWMRFDGLDNPVHGNVSRGEKSPPTLLRWPTCKVKDIPWGLESDAADSITEL